MRGGPRLYEPLGAHKKKVQGIDGVSFSTWAPNAKEVFVHLGEESYPMRDVNSGIWERFIPGVKEGDPYRYAIRTQNGSLLLKSDPFAFSHRLRPNRDSVVADVDTYCWQDRDWINNRKTLSLNRPINIYEVHLGSWQRKEGAFLNYRDIAQKLALYCRDMGYTHVELLPITEHPLDESWGYQVTGFFSVTSRFGTPSDFQFFVDHLHGNGIGVILDWVPAHFPIDDWALHRFDGTPLFEHGDLRRGFQPEWNTAIFDYGKKTVREFLIASALFFIEKMHIDGIRVDAVSSMLYLDYKRKKGEWQPNVHGDNHNLEAIEFLTKLNETVHELFPGVLMIAEEASSFPGVTEKLGFDLKWNMGWMNDTLKYISKDFGDRGDELTFSMMYAFSERFVNPFSHDEVVHGKASLLSKMKGEDPQKFAGMRLLYSYMMCHPGKKLLFMGGEFGQWSEWNCQQELNWGLLQHERHCQLAQMVKDLNHLYLNKGALWENDFSWDGYEWVDFSKRGVFSYLRKGKQSALLVAHNFLPKAQLFLEKKGVEIFNTNRREYGGSGGDFIESIPPLTTVIFEVE